MLKQQQEIPEKQPKLTEQKAHTKNAPVYGDGFNIKLPLLYLGTHHQMRGYSEKEVSLIFFSLLKQVDWYRAFK